MDSHEARSAIVGFDLSGDAMLRGEMLSFEQGLTVFYGLNGTGKSRLLRGIRGALLGIQTDVAVSLIAHAHSTQASRSWVGEEWGVTLQGDPRPFARAVAQELATPADFDASPGQRSSQRRLSNETVDDIVSRHIEQLAGFDFDLKLRAEVLDDRLFLLCPTGTNDSPSWAVHAVADASRPGAQDAIARVRALENSYPDFEDSDAWDEHVDKIREEPVLEDSAQFFVAHGARRMRVSPSSVVLYRAGVNDLEFEAPITLTGLVDFGVDLLELEHDVNHTVGNHFSALVAGALRDDERFEDDHDFDVVLPLAEPGQAERYWHRLDEAYHDKARALVERIVTETAAELSLSVTEILGDVLRDKLVARLLLAPTALQTVSPAMQWRFHRELNPGVTVGLAELSKAERMWAERAINEAVFWHRRKHHWDADEQTRPAVYLYDEPEAALHRSAEAFMARSLVQRAKTPPRSLMVATHSPELLDTTEARLVNLQHAKIPHAPTVQRLDLSDRNALRELGLTPSDLLRWPRVLLLVEGLHDEVLLDHYLGERLRAARVDIIALRGGTKLPLTVDSKVLFEHTDAHVVGLVDNGDAETLQETWARALNIRAQGNIQGAIEAVLDGIPRVRSEDDFIRNWLTSALQKGLDGRITPYALERADIIEYLPVEAFVPTASSWEELRVQHAAAKEAKKPNVARDFKAWLNQMFGATFTEESLRAAAAGTATPREFERFMKTIEAISAKRS